MKDALLTLATMLVLTLATAGLIGSLAYLCYWWGKVKAHRRRTLYDDLQLATTDQLVSQLVNRQVDRKASPFVLIVASPFGMLVRSSNPDEAETANFLRSAADSLESKPQEWPI